MRKTTVDQHYVRKSPQGDYSKGVDSEISAMSKKNIFVAVCSSYQTAEKAIYSLQQAHFNVRRVSVIGKDYFYLAEFSSDALPEEKRLLADVMTFWGRIWRLLSGDAFLRLEGIGSIIVAGRISDSIRKAGTNPALYHAHSPLRASMLAVGIASENLAKFEAALQSDRLLVIVQGDPHEVLAAAKILKLRENYSKSKAGNTELGELRQAGSNSAKAEDKKSADLPPELMPVKEKDKMASEMNRKVERRINER
jgi:hypothetical protein